jgi:hypothetical protein
MELPAGRGGTMSASLQGTLTPQGLLSAAEAEQKRLEEEQAARAASLAQGAGEAAGAFQQAAAAPMPQLNPMAALIQSLGGNVASIIGETPRYAQNAQADLSAQKDELLAKRAQNLAALKDNYDRQAAAALSAGDLLAEAKLRKSAESVSKAWQAIHDEAAAKQSMNELDIKNKATASEGKLDRESRERIAALAASRAASSGGAAEILDTDIAKYALAVESGQAPLTAFPNRKGNDVRSRVVAYMQDNNMVILPQKARDTIQALLGAKSVIGDLADMSLGPVGPDGIRVGGFAQSKEGLDRLKAGAGATWQGFTQSKSDIAVFQKMRKGWLATIARAAGEKGTLSDRDIARAEQMMPSVYDSREVVSDSFARMEAFLEEIKQRTIQNYSTPLTGPRAGQAPSTMNTSAPSNSTADSETVRKNPKAEAMTAARKNDRNGLKKLLENNPSLRSDPDIIAQARRLAGGK